MVGWEKIVITKAEALRLIGIKDSSLAIVEKIAKIKSDSRRKGYTSKQLNGLLQVVRTALKRYRGSAPRKRRKTV